MRKNAGDGGWDEEIVRIRRMTAKEKNRKR